MTTEKLQTANEKLKEIEILKNFHTAFNDADIQEILLTKRDKDGLGGSHNVFRFDNYDHGELKRVINGYFENRIKQLEEEFENL